MRRVSLEAFVREVEALKQSLGVTEAMIEAPRNSGERRTPAKRDSLARIQERARRAGLEPLPARF